MIVTDKQNHNNINSNRTAFKSHPSKNPKVITGQDLSDGPIKELDYYLKLSGVNNNNVANINLLSELTRKIKLLGEIAIKDDLTKLLNRRSFDNALKNAFDNAKNNKTPLSVASLDFDYFKSQNDLFGHQHGDRMLKEIAKTIKDTIKETPGASAYRYGGEEFSVVFDGIPEEKAKILAVNIAKNIQNNKNFKNSLDKYKQKCRQEIDNIGNSERNTDISRRNQLKTWLEHVEKNNGFTISSGLASLNKANNIENPDAFYKLADDALKTLKDQGKRNNIAIYNKDGKYEIVNPAKTLNTVI